MIITAADGSLAANLPGCDSGAVPCVRGAGVIGEIAWCQGVASGAGQRPWGVVVPHLPAVGRPFLVGRPPDSPLFLARPARRWQVIQRRLFISPKV